MTRFSRKRSSRKKEKKAAPLPLEDRLENLMDKLAMWQLFSTVSEQPQFVSNGKGKDRVRDDRDWMQRFCEDVVQPAYVYPTCCKHVALANIDKNRFAEKVPEMYELLHTKVFRHSLFSSASSSEDEPDIEAIPDDQPKPKRPALRKQESRSRSRSLSISLEAERRAGTAAGKKRMLSREISMNKVFKKPRLDTPTLPAITLRKPAPEVENNLKPGGDNILVASTPVKGSAAATAKRASFARFGSQQRIVKMEVEEDPAPDPQDENVFAASTPVKSRTSMLGLRYRVPDADEDEETEQDVGEEGDEEEWLIGSPSFRATNKSFSSSDPDDRSSPDVLLLEP